MITKKGFHYWYPRFNPDIECDIIENENDWILVIPDDRAYHLKRRPIIGVSISFKTVMGAFIGPFKGDIVDFKGNPTIKVLEKVYIYEIKMIRIRKTKFCIYSNQPLYHGFNPPL